MLIVHQCNQASLSKCLCELMNLNQTEFWSEKHKSAICKLFKFTQDFVLQVRTVNFAEHLISIPMHCELLKDSNLALPGFFCRPTRDYCIANLQPACCTLHVRCPGHKDFQFIPSFKLHSSSSLSIILMPNTESLL